MIFCHFHHLKTLSTDVLNIYTAEAVLIKNCLGDTKSTHHTVKNLFENFNLSDILKCCNGIYFD